MAPCIFQDDLLHGAGGLEEARIANSKVDKIMKERALELNQEKTTCIVLGSKKQKEQIFKEMKENPLKCGSFETKAKETEKWLGQYLSSKGLTDSVAKTIEAREGKVKGACLEIIQIVNDWRAEVVGGMETGLMLWEKCGIPSLLHGAGTWVEMAPDSVKRLNSLQRWFMRMLLQVGPGVPTASLTWESGLLDMEQRVWVEKLMLIFHLRSLNEETFARQIYEKQKEQKWPGLAEEAARICEELNVEDVNETNIPKKDFKTIVIEACKQLDEKKLRVAAEGKEKCSKIMRGKYGKKKYFEQKKIKDVRKVFQAKVSMLPFAGNFKKDRRFAKTQWLCRCLEEKEEERHILGGKCPVYRDLFEKFENLDNDDNLVDFFGEVLSRKDALDAATLVEGDTTDTSLGGGSPTPSQPRL